MSCFPSTGYHPVTLFTLSSSFPFSHPSSANILHDPSPLRQSISSPEFQRLFGNPSPHPKGHRQNIFGNQDQLKTAPKGIDKNHAYVATLHSIPVIDLGKIAILIYSSVALLPSSISELISTLPHLSSSHLSSFTDAQVLDPQFKNSIASIVQVMQPFVHWSVLTVSFTALISLVIV